MDRLILEKLIVNRADWYKSNRLELFCLMKETGMRFKSVKFLKNNSNQRTGGLK